jgi:hypothetical protein
VNPPSNIKIAHDFHIFWGARVGEIIQYLVDGGFVKRPFITERPQIKLQRLELYA